MIDPEDAHVGAVSGSPLADDVTDGVIENPHDRHRAASLTAGGMDRIATRSDFGKIHSGAAAQSLDIHGVGKGFKYASSAVLDGKHEAGASAAVVPSKISEGWAVGKKIQISHQRRITIGPMSLRCRIGFVCRDGIGHPTAKGFPMFSLCEKPFFQYGDGVFGKCHRTTSHPLNISDLL